MDRSGSPSTQIPIKLRCSVDLELKDWEVGISKNVWLSHFEGNSDLHRYVLLLTSTKLHLVSLKQTNLVPTSDNHLIGYVNPILYFNLGNESRAELIVYSPNSIVSDDSKTSPLVSSKNLPKSNSTTHRALAIAAHLAPAEVLDEGHQKSPPIASSVILEPVRSPFLSNSDIVDTALKGWINQGPIIELGDLIVLPYSKRLVPPYFGVWMVAELSVSGINAQSSTQVVAGETQLSLRSMQLSRLPRRVYSFLYGGTEFLPLEVFPESAVKTFQTSWINSMLVSGPSGSGKSLFVRSVADSLGYHFIEFDLRRFIAGGTAGPQGVVTQSQNRTQEDDRLLRYFNPCSLTNPISVPVGSEPETSISPDLTLGFVFQKALESRPCLLSIIGLETLSADSMAASAQQSGPGTSNALVAVSNTLVSCLQDWGSIWRSFREPGLNPEYSDRLESVVIGTSRSESSQLPSSLSQAFDTTMTLSPPTDPQKTLILEHVTKGCIDPESATLIQSSTSGWWIPQIVSLTRRCFLASRTSPRSLSKTLETRLKPWSEYQRTELGTPTIPDTSFDDIGGLETAKSIVLESIQLPLTSPQLFNGSLASKRSGLLLYGPPGSGKTLMAKAVASSTKCSFLSVKGPELLNPYVGQSEANIRSVFAKARSSAPCVIFFDELDSLAPARGRGSDGGGIMDRIVGQLLAELDSPQSPDPDTSNFVFVIGATNRPDLLDPSLLRPGRLDKLVYTGVASTPKDKYTILKALTRKFRLDPGLDLLSIAEQMPDGLSGADMYSVTSRAFLGALNRRSTALRDEFVKSLSNSQAFDQTEFESYVNARSESELEIRLDSQDFLTAMSNVTPSISPHEMKRYEALRAKFEGSSK